MSRPLRSARWFEAATRMGHTHRQRILQAGFSRGDWKGKPVIAVLSTWSELNPCHIHLRERAEDVKRGIWQAGGFPVEVPVMSLGEPFMKPTTMLYRNLLAIETEEVLRCHPVDGAVLLGGCDKTTPGLLLGAISMNLPAIYVPAGPMLTGRWRGKALGSGTDTAKAFNDWKAGVLSDAEFHEMEEAGARSPGTCMTMGTASTMTSLAEVLGMTLSGASSIPAPDSRHRHMAVESGRRAVAMVAEDLKPTDILSSASFANAIVTLMALGGSTNAVIHLVAMARRAGLPLSLEDFDAASGRVPVLADMRPSGRFLMEDFFEAGGLRGLLSRIDDLLDLSARTVEGRSLGQAIAGARVWNDEVIRPRENPLQASGGLVVVRGNLCPDGAVLKVSAASPHLLRHTGPALVFEGWADFASRVDRDDLPVTPATVMILRNCGPRGVPGMPEWGMMQVPAKLLKQGLRDILRISDARMSGTHFGTVVLHAAPEAAIGGPLALVRDGDLVSLDAAARRLDLLVDEAELARRRAAWVPPEPKHARGWARLYAEQVLQADAGADLEVLLAGPRNPEPEIN
ncbi:L-arabinonate dehydratase [Falsiroseomonas sp. HW251]|uniref:L-arabinonate dehydratase n=1 Tax=Falsiroseomonas sp. HW251 TaxID=3390998 RepID=UPI003D3122F0